MAAQEPSASSAGTSAAAGGPYFLACNVCRWNSQEIGMKFEKPTSLALQLQKNEEALADAKEFDHLKEHFEKHLRANAPPAIPSSFLSFSNSGAFSKMMGSHFHDTQAQGKLDDIETYDPSLQVPDEDLKTVENMISLRTVDQVSTMGQRSTQLHDQPYQLRNYIPNITIVKLPRKNWPLQFGIPTQFVLKFTNPLYEEMSITLATPQMRRKSITPEEVEKSKIKGKVTILSPHFTVGAYNETIEYDDEMYPSAAAARRNTGLGSGGLLSSWVDGVYEKRNNYTSVIVEVVPEKAGEFKFPLLVTYNYKMDEDRMDVSSGDIDVEDIDDLDADSMDGSKKANSSMRLDDERIKSYSFWCLIGLGETEDRQAQ
ncbi:hypothetical protein DFQ28_005193 [Apophysomyces sp. BC1034]|nr:hypothetical protein DFQ29_004088 [Apophysomyces sp. BC1021]KAG0188235.1 hypothetical protein DFQ28_005193 [Apophysomyces sp. BC1034]